MYSDLFRLALNNLFRARVRLLITSSGVFIGTLAVILLIALTNGLQASAESDLGDNATLTEIYVYPNYQTVEFTEDVPQITFETLEEIRNLDDVASIVATIQLGRSGKLAAGRYVADVHIIGVEPEQVANLPVRIESGDLTTFESGDMLLAEDLLNKFVDPNSREPWIGEDIDVYNENLTLVLSNSEEEQRNPIKTRAVFSSDNFSYIGAIFLPFEDVIAIQGWMTGEDILREDIIFEEALVYSTGRESTLPLVEQIEALGYATDSLGDFLAEINNFFNLMRAILGGIGVIALVIAAFGVANTMMMAILERTSEIGLMKAVGARDRDVLILFLMEAGLVGLVGGILGAAASLLLRDRINLWIATEAQNSQLSILIDSAELNGDLVIISNELLFFAILLATTIGLLAGALPAWRAAKMSPVIALKEE